MAKQPVYDNGKTLSLKVTEKGAVGLYGLRRFPATFYADEWEMILSKADAIRKFITANRAHLKSKPSEGGVEGGTRI